MPVDVKSMLDVDNPLKSAVLMTLLGFIVTGIAVYVAHAGNLEPSLGTVSVIGGVIFALALMKFDVMPTVTKKQAIATLLAAVLYGFVVYGVNTWLATGTASPAKILGAEEVIESSLPAAETNPAVDPIAEILAGMLLMIGMTAIATFVNGLFRAPNAIAEMFQGENFWAFAGFTVVGLLLNIIASIAIPTDISVVARFILMLIPFLAMMLAFEYYYGRDPSIEPAETNIYLVSAIVIGLILGLVAPWAYQGAAKLTQSAVDFYAIITGTTMSTTAAEAPAGVAVVLSTAIAMLTLMYLSALVVAAMG